MCKSDVVSCSKREAEHGYRKQDQGREREAGFNQTNELFGTDRLAWRAWLSDWPKIQFEAFNISLNCDLT